MDLRTLSRSEARRDQPVAVTDDNLDVVASGRLVAWNGRAIWLATVSGVTALPTEGLIVWAQA